MHSFFRFAGCVNPTNRVSVNQHAVSGSHVHPQEFLTLAQHCAGPSCCCGVRLKKWICVTLTDVWILLHDSPEPSVISWSPHPAKQMGLCSNWWLCQFKSQVSVSQSSKCVVHRQFLEAVTQLTTKFSVSHGSSTVLFASNGRQSLAYTRRVRSNTF